MKAFLDSNILVYAVSDDPSREPAKAVLRSVGRNHASNRRCL